MDDENYKIKSFASRESVAMIEQWTCYQRHHIIIALITNQ